PDVTYTTPRRWSVRTGRLAPTNEAEPLFHHRPSEDIMSLIATAPAGKYIDSARLSEPGYQAFLLLRTVFTIAPIVFGIDKFFNVLAEWPVFLAPWMDSILPGTAQQGMYIVGVVEIV